MQVALGNGLGTTPEALRNIPAALDAHAIVSVTNAAGEITYINQKFCDISGYSRDELLGRDHRIVRSGQHPPEFYRDIWKTISGGNIWNGEICNRKRNGSLYWVESTIMPFLDAEGIPCQYVSIRTDVSRQKRREQIAIAIANARSQLMAGGHLPHVFEELLAKVLDLADASFGLIGERHDVDDGGDAETHPTLSLLAVTDISRSKELCIEGACPENLDSLLGAPLRTGKVIVSRDCAADFHAPEFPPGFPVLHNFLGLPLLRGGTTIGVLGLANRNGDFDEEMLDLLAPVTSAISGMIESLNLRRRHQALVRSLAEARDEAETSSRAKSEFLARMSHELRTPLNAIIGFGQLLSSDPRQPLSMDQKESVDYILEAGQRLLRLVDDVLQLADLQSGKTDLRTASVSLTSLARDCRDRLFARAAQQDIALEIQATEQDFQVRADPERLAQVIDQLLDNGLRFNHRGGQLCIAFFENARQRGLVVSNTGIGFAQDDAELIFHPFSAISGRPATAGKGVGLALARHLIERMGGHLGADGHPGGGARFTLSLPIPPATDI